MVTAADVALALAAPSETVAVQVTLWPRANAPASGAPLSFQRYAIDGVESQSSLACTAHTRVSPRYDSAGNVTEAIDGALSVAAISAERDSAPVAMPSSALAAQAIFCPGTK